MKYFKRNWKACRPNLDLSKFMEFTIEKEEFESKWN
jgi:hypothetical protein